MIDRHAFSKADEAGDEEQGQKTIEFYFYNEEK